MPPRLGSHTCLPRNHGARTPTGTTPARAATPSSANAIARRSGTGKITGAVTAAYRQGDNSTVRVQGWACRHGSDESVQLEVRVGGQIVLQDQPRLTMDKEAHGRCRASKGAKLRYDLTIATRASGAVQVFAQPSGWEVCANEGGRPLDVVEATSSSVAHGGAASRVVDGKDGGGSWETGTCAHTQQRASWIRLDLGAPKAVSRLELVGRNAYAVQSTGWTIRVGNGGSASDSVCMAGVDASGGAVVLASCAEPMVGRYVTLSSPTTMVLCEAWVLGASTEPGEAALSRHPGCLGAAPVPLLCRAQVLACGCSCAVYAGKAVDVDVDVCVFCLCAVFGVRVFARGTFAPLLLWSRDLPMHRAGRVRAPVRDEQAAWGRRRGRLQHAGRQHHLGVC